MNSHDCSLLKFVDCWHNNVSCIHAVLKGECVYCRWTQSSKCVVCLVQRVGSGLVLCLPLPSAAEREDVNTDLVRLGHQDKTLWAKWLQQGKPRTKIPPVCFLAGALFLARSWPPSGCVLTAGAQASPRKVTNPLDQGSALVILFNLSSFLEAPSPNKSGEGCAIQRMFVSPHVRMLESSPQCDGIWKWDF